MAYYVRFSVSKITKYGTPIADCVFIVRIKLFVNLPEKSPDSEGRVSFFFSSHIIFLRKSVVVNHKFISWR